jgi:hypothetical protein
VVLSVQWPFVCSTCVVGRITQQPMIEVAVSRAVEFQSVPASPLIFAVKQGLYRLEYWWRPDALTGNVLSDAASDKISTLEQANGRTKRD